MNEDLLILIAKCIKNNCIIISIDYINNKGLIEDSEGRPSTIYYSEERGWH